MENSNIYPEEAPIYLTFPAYNKNKVNFKGKLVEFCSFERKTRTEINKRLQKVKNRQMFRLKVLPTKLSTDDGVPLIITISPLMMMVILLMIKKVTMMMDLMVLYVHDVKKKSCKSTLQGEWVGFSKRAMESELLKCQNLSWYFSVFCISKVTFICFWQRRWNKDFQNAKSKVDTCPVRRDQNHSLLVQYSLRKGSKKHVFFSNL